MIRRFGLAWCTLGFLALAALGCHSPHESFLCTGTGVSHYKRVATEIEFPDTQVARLPDAAMTEAPRTLRSAAAEQLWDLPLQEAIQTALVNSKVMRDLGGRVLTAPSTVSTVYNPSIQESDPRFGVEGALSAFDAQMSSSFTWQKNDRPVNQVVPGFTLPVFTQDLGIFQSGIQKTNATGGTWAVRNNVRYEANNNPNNTFPSWYDANMEIEFRQPLLQGAGVEFNRIAGPNATPGFFFSNGVLIARLNHDISLADFEAGTIRLVSDVENAYWDLYYAYRDLDAKVAARDLALETWRRAQALMKSGSPGGEAENEAQAREQYLLFRAQVEDALSGIPGGSTQSGSGSSAGIFRGTGGVYAREANLRFLMGIASNDGRLIRPSEEPTTGRVEFCWEEILTEAFCRRVELRRQRWLVKRREYELCASRNFLMPRLDVTGTYRWRGLGDDLIGQSDEPFSSAYQNLYEGDFQESQLGVQFNMPIGQRQAMAGVRNAELNLARERSILQEQELQVSHDLGNAIRELDRAYQLTETNFNRRIAAQRQLNAVQAARNAGRVAIDVLLDSQRRLADAETAYFRSLLEYNLAIKAVQFEKGSLLEYNNVCLSEGPWPCKAYSDACRIAKRRAAAERIDYALTQPCNVSRGRFPQHTGSAIGLGGGEMQMEEAPSPPLAPTDVLPTPDGERSPGEPPVLPGPTSNRGITEESGPALGQSGPGRGKGLIRNAPPIQPTGGVVPSDPVDVGHSPIESPLSSLPTLEGKAAAAPDWSVVRTSPSRLSSAGTLPHASQSSGQADRPLAGWQRAQR